MVIRKQDRVSDVLKHDESLIDVFIALSPAFERLRNRGLRKVMARLVTVEQAAKMGGVDPEELVARLNAGGAGAEIPASSDPRAAAQTSGRGALPPVLADLPNDRIIDVDVRGDLRNGREPFSRIMAARRELPAGGALRVRAIFEPVPLYEALARQGLGHHTEQLGVEDWRVWFFEDEERGRDASPVTPGAAAGLAAGDDAGTGSVGRGAAGNDERAGDAAGDVVVLDVRGLEPPEPMVRTLAALETLPPDATLVQINVRVPQFLLPQLEARGFAYEIREQAPDLVRVFIRNK